MIIKTIQIQNIKGLSNNTFNLNLIPNKPNILVAPNGFGKSSFAIAFASLKTNKIELNDKNYFENNQDNRPFLSIKINESGTDSILFANDTINTITDVFDVFVINNQVEPKSTVQNFGGHTIAKSSLEISPIILKSTIPQKTYFNYSSANEKSSFGRNGSKILTNISPLLSNGSLFYRIETEINLNKFSQKRNSNKLQDLKDKINSQNDTGNAIKQWISENLLDEFKTFKELHNLASIINSFDFNIIKNETESFLAAFQIISIYQSDTANFKKSCKYLYYLDEKEDYTKMIKSFNSTRFDIKPKEDKRKGLIVKWPKAHEISNGQRDVLSFITLMLKARSAFHKKNCILIIDEIFDYLDDGNLISFQYFITNFIEEMKQQSRNFFPILLTHLDPMFFNHFAFNKHNLKVHFLKEMNAKTNRKLLNIIYNRENEKIKDSVDAYFFHYYPDNIDLTLEFRELNLNTDWAESDKFHKKIQREVRRYLYSPDEKYDPLAICFGVRVQIEKLIYEKITDVENKHKFIGENGTKKKLHFCEKIGIDIPETYYLLGIIYNTSLHLKEGQDITNPLAIKLENITIKKLIKEIFE
jgi:hypothetical protein